MNRDGNIYLAITPSCTTSPGFGHCIIQLLQQFGDACVEKKPQFKHCSNSLSLDNYYRASSVWSLILLKCRQLRSGLKRAAVSFQRVCINNLRLLVQDRNEFLKLTNKAKHRYARTRYTRPCSRRWYDSLCQ